MPTTPQDNSNAQNVAAQPLPQPDILPANDLETLASHSAEYVNLIDTQKMVLLAIMEDFISEDIRTDVDMASDLGIDRKTIYNCKRNPRFNRAMTQLMPEMVKAKLPKYLTMVEDHGVKDWKAIEFLLKYAGLYTPTQQNLNVNANVGRQMDQQGSITESKDTLLTRMGELGWSVERVQEFAASIPARFEELRSEGAF